MAIGAGHVDAAISRAGPGLDRWVGRLNLRGRFVDTANSMRDRDVGPIGRESEA